MLPHYLVAQSLFFLGAAWFRKVHFVKTVGARLAIAFGLCADRRRDRLVVRRGDWDGGTANRRLRWRIFGRSSG